MAVPKQATRREITSSEGEETDTHSEMEAKSAGSTYNIRVRGGKGNYVFGRKAKLLPSSSLSEELSTSRVLKNIDVFLQEVETSRGPEKDRKEYFVVKEVLPEIESHAMKSKEHHSHTLDILVRLTSTALQTPRIAKHALKLLDKVVSMDVAEDKTNAHLVEAEKCLRQSIVDGSFKTELLHDQRRRLEVYCNVLVAVMIGRAKEHISCPFLKNDREEISSCIFHIENVLTERPVPRKNRRRLSLEIILSLLLGENPVSPHKAKRFNLIPSDSRNSITTGFPDTERLKKLLKTCHQMLDNDWSINTEYIDSLMKQAIFKEDGTVYLIIILKWLHSKINSQPRAFELFKAIISRHPLFHPSWSPSREQVDWYFALLVCQTFVDVTENHKLKDTRLDAAHFLKTFRGIKALSKSAVICNIVDSHIRRATFAHDIESRRLLLGALIKESPDEKISLDLLRKRISKANQRGFLEISDTICENERHITMRGNYSDKPVAVKVISVSISRLLVPPDKLTNTEKVMKNEIAIVKSFTSKENAFVPVCYLADTNRLPYHFILEYAENGDLRSYLLDRREKNPLSYRQVLHTCLASAKAMDFLQNELVVHNHLRAEHLLVGKDHKYIKVASFGRAKCIKNAKEVCEGECLNPHDPSIRWTAPCGLQDPPLCSSLSDIWAFGVLMYEIVNCGGLPYPDKSLEEVRDFVLAKRYLMKEPHMKDGYYGIMQRCFGQSTTSFGLICNELQRLIDECNDADDIPLTIPRSAATVHEEGYEGVYNTKYTTVMTGEDVYQNVMEMSMTQATKKKAILNDGSTHHVNNVKRLDNEFLVKIFKVKKKSNIRVLTHEHYPEQCLGDFLKTDPEFSVEEFSRFCAQICSALNYLHSQDIVHCNLTLDNVYIVNRRYVKLAGLQYTRSLRHFDDNTNASICISGPGIEQGQYRWHPPEVIQEGLYSKASDIWSLGMLMWSMFCCLDDDLKYTFHENVPLSKYKDDEVLSKLKEGSRPSQTSNCPDWIYIVMTQCWLHRACERASSLSILECLTLRNPWEAYVLKIWWEKHRSSVSERWPNLNVTQEYAEEFTSPPSQDVRKSITEEFAGIHSYDYSPWTLSRGLPNAGKTKSTIKIPSSSSTRSRSSSSSVTSLLSSKMTTLSMERFPPEKQPSVSMPLPSRLRSSSQVSESIQNNQDIDIYQDVYIDQREFQSKAPPEWILATTSGSDKNYVELQRVVSQESIHQQSLTASVNKDLEETSIGSTSRSISEDPIESISRHQLVMAKVTDDPEYDDVYIASRLRSSLKVSESIENNQDIDYDDDDHLYADPNEFLDLHKKSAPPEEDPYDEPHIVMLPFSQDGEAENYEHSRALSEPSSKETKYIDGAESTKMKPKQIQTYSEYEITKSTFSEENQAESLAKAPPELTLATTSGSDKNYAQLVVNHESIHQKSLTASVNKDLEETSIGSRSISEDPIESISTHQLAIAKFTYDPEYDDVYIESLSRSSSQVNENFKNVNQPAQTSLLSSSSQVNVPSDQVSEERDSECEEIFV